MKGWFTKHGPVRRTGEKVFNGNIIDKNIKNNKR